MKVLLKIKSVLLLLVVVITTTNIAEARNNPFVKWDNVPVLTPWKNTADAATMIDYLKKAATGIQPVGSKKLYATPAHYKEAWGEVNYQTIMAAPLNRFGFALSRGGEQNTSIDVDGNLVVGVILEKDAVGLIWLDNVAIAKWDENGCLNAIVIPHQTTPVTPPVQVNFPQAPAGGNNNQQIIYLSAPKSEMTMNDYLTASSIAEAKQLNAIYAGAALMKDGVNTGASLKTCCEGGGSGGNAGLGVSNVVYSQGYQQTAQQSGGYINTNYSQQNIRYNEPGLGARNWGSAIKDLAYGFADVYRATNNDRQDINIRTNSVNRNINSGYYYVNGLNGNGNGNGNGNSNFVPFHAPTGGSTRGNTSGNGTIRITRSGERNDFN